MRPLIKICGITNLEDALLAAELNIWALGFVFADSARRISEKTAKDIIEKLPPYIARVGVFVNDEIDNIKKVIGFCKIDIIQLHGEESPEFCKNVRAFAKVIKAFRVKDEDSLEGISDYDADLYLLDTYSPKKYGGTGKSFDWGLAAKTKKYGKNIILAGGLNSTNIIEAIKTVNPYAVDVSSGIESAPGKKDKVLLKELVSKVNNL